MSNKLPLIFGLLFLLLQGCAQQPATPLQIEGIAQLPALAAEFETTVVEADAHEHSETPAPHIWRFWRGPKFVETLDLNDQSGDSWTKAADGTISYQSLFHDQKQLIDYVPGDLKAIGSELDWSALATLLNSAMIAPLRADGTEQVLGRTAIHYQSNDPAKPIEVLWLVQEQLPAMIKYTDNGHIVTTRLTAIYPLAQSPWPYQRAADYRSTDFADLGDKEGDPFIKSIQHKLKGGHNHVH